MADSLTLRQLATAINARLKALEVAHPALGWKGAGCYYMGGARLRITYISRQGGETLSREKANRFLAWLESGFVGRHTEKVPGNVVASTQKLDS
jgi:hypothetical protein